VHALPEPKVGTVAVLGDFALRCGRKYATVLIDAVTHPDSTCSRNPPGRDPGGLAACAFQAEVVCRDGSATHATRSAISWIMGRPQDLLDHTWTT
jgi:hypothetical protein